MNAGCFFGGGVAQFCLLKLLPLPGGLKFRVDQMVDQNCTNIRIDNIKIKSYYLTISVTSGASTRKGMEVRVFSWAPFSSLPIGNLL